METLPEADPLDSTPTKALPHTPLSDLIRLDGVVDVPGYEDKIWEVDGPFRIIEELRHKSHTADKACGS